MNFLIGISISLAGAILVLFIPWVGVGVLHLYSLFGIVVPYLAILIFLVGMIVRVIDWGRSPVPFRIPTTAGQQWSFPWIKHSWIENPKNTLGVIVRMALEVLCFRSLFRNVRLEYRRIENLPKIAFEWEKWLWMAAIAFHYSFFVIFIRHFRLFTDPVPGIIEMIEKLDGFFQAGVLPISGLTIPGVYVTDMLLLAAVTYLLVRRLYISQVRYVSLPSDYFPLFLILGIGTTGVLMRYIVRVDITKVKELALGLFKFQPHVPDGIGVIFFIHLFFVWIPNIEIALMRIKKRVENGGHNIPAIDVRRRFHRSINNFFILYKPLLDSWMLFDNSAVPPRLIAKAKYKKLEVSDNDLFRKIRPKGDDCNVKT